MALLDRRAIYTKGSDGTTWAKIAIVSSVNSFSENTAEAVWNSPPDTVASAARVTVAAQASAVRLVESEGSD